MAVEDREKWRRLVVKSSVVPQQLLWWRDRWRYLTERPYLKNPLQDPSHRLVLVTYYWINLILEVGQGWGCSFALARQSQHVVKTCIFVCWFEFDLQSIKSKYLFFCFSSFEGNASNDLDLGDEVEYTLARKGNKMSAENIRKLAKGTVGPGEVILVWDVLHWYSILSVGDFLPFTFILYIF